MTGKICPIISRPYVHSFSDGGFSEEETRLAEIICIEDRCMAWDTEKETCKLIGGA
jgi:hypothetical protein